MLIRIFLLAMVFCFGSVYAEMSEEDRLKVEQVEQSVKLAQYFESEIAELIASEVRVEKDFEIVGYKIKAIHEPNGDYENDKGMAFVECPLVMLFEPGIPREILEWMNWRVPEKVGHMFHHLSIDEETRLVLFGF